MKSSSISSRWYLVQTLARREVWAAHQLEKQGMRTFLPKTLKTVRHARKLSTSVGAFFPCYLFVHLDLVRQRWRSVNGTFGVACLVMAGEQPAPVPAGVVEGLMAACDQNGLISSPPFEPGQRVQITSGPFADQVATVVRLDDAGRVKVLLGIMGGEAPVEIGQARLIAAG